MRCKDLTHWKRSWCWERLKAGGKGDNRGCDGWMASPNQRTWVWASSRSCWWTRKPGMLQSMGSQGVGNDWVTQLNCEIYLAGCWIFLFDAWIRKIPWRRARPTLRYSCLDNPRGQRRYSLAGCTAAVLAWQATVHGVAKSQDMTERPSTAQSTV